MANDGSVGAELWKSDGTSSGTALVCDIRPGSSGSYNGGGSGAVTYLVNVNGTWFLTVDDGAHGNELWTSDGTSAGTKLVRDIISGTASSIILFPCRTANTCS